MTITRVFKKCAFHAFNQSFKSAYSLMALLLIVVFSPIMAVSQALPNPWISQDIGDVGFSSSASEINGNFTISASGSDIWGTSDAFHYVYQPFIGDAEIVARVTSVEYTDPWAKAGVMIRETLNANSPHATVIMTPGNGTAFQRRISTGANSTHTSGGSAVAPVWVKLVRSANIFRGYKSSDGVTWVLIGTETIPMASSVYVGLAVTSHTNSTLCTATLDNVTFRGSGGNSTPTLYGLHMDLLKNGYASVRAQAIQNAKAINAKVSRNTFPWDIIERQRGVRDWSRTDAVVNELQSSGIEPLFTITGSPSWANGISNSTPEAYAYVPTTEPAFSNWVANYKSFVTEAVQRYKGRVKKWELWNEQNDIYQWKPVPRVDQYGRWYTEIYSAIKYNDPAAEVASGGMAGLCCTGPTGINGFSFLQQLYDRGIYPDNVAIHPYSDQQQAPDVHLPWTGNFDDIAKVRNIMVANGQGSKNIWLTEWGWTTNIVSESQQADYVTKSLEMIKTQYPYVSVATYFLDYDRPPQYFQGLYTSDFRLKPAGERFRDFLDN